MPHFLNLLSLLLSSECRPTSPSTFVIPEATGRVLRAGDITAVASVVTDVNSTHEGAEGTPSMLWSLIPLVARIIW